MKIDPHKHQEKYLRWKEKTQQGIPDLTPADSRLILQFLSDMELGLNVAPGSRKGPRSYIRLNNLRQRLIFLARELRARHGRVSITEITEEELHRLFSDMRTGGMTRLDGKTYASTGDYVAVFKTFWHWWMRIQRKAGQTVSDICVDLDTRSEKAPWVYLTEEQVKKLCNNAKFNYRVLMMFLFDSGIRCPTELVNVQVSDLSADRKKLKIRISKTFSRQINLMLCPPLLAEYIREKEFGATDYLFPISPVVVNRYLKRLGARVLGDAPSQGGKRFSELTMYSFRHSSACYWLPRYKSESALKYRFGWKKSEMIHYYTEFLGMKDTITDEDMLVDVSRTEIEKRLEQAERRNTILQDKLQTMENQMVRILAASEALLEKAA
jgi:hypothetical protein